MSVINFERITRYIGSGKEPVITPNDRKKVEELLAKQIDDLFKNVALESCGIYSNVIEAEFKRIEIKELSSPEKFAVADLKGKA